MPISGTKEIVANSVVMIVFMQVGFAVRSQSMLRADFLVVMMPKTDSENVADLWAGIGRGVLSVPAEGRDHACYAIFR